MLPCSPGRAHPATPANGLTGDAATSRTLVFDAPRRARFLFEALIGDNLDIGRPANVEIIFARRIRRDTPGTFPNAERERGGPGRVVRGVSVHDVGAAEELP